MWPTSLNPRRVKKWQKSKLLFIRHITINNVLVTERPQRLRIFRRQATKDWQSEMTVRLRILWRWLQRNLRRRTCYDLQYRLFYCPVGNSRNGRAEGISLLFNFHTHTTNAIYSDQRVTTNWSRSNYSDSLYSKHVYVWRRRTHTD